MKDKLGLYTLISLGIFLFVLFFEPFPIYFHDLNNSLIFNAGLGGIVFLFIILVSVIFPWITKKNMDADEVDDVLSYFRGFAILILSSVAFAFYLRFVGGINITFYIMFRVVLICIVPPILLRLYSVRAKSIFDNNFLQIENTSLKNQIDKFEENLLNISLEFVSENSAENAKFQLSSIAFIKSADNYVEIYFVEEEVLKRKLLRNTLKNIEIQLKPYAIFVRCHRTCIVNAKHIQKLNREINNYWLTIMDSTEKLPVSRQYILKLKEAISLL